MHLSKIKETASTCSAELVYLDIRKLNYVILEAIAVEQTSVGRPETADASFENGMLIERYFQQNKLSPPYLLS